MVVSEIAFWIGIVTLYVGFSGVLGLLIHRAWPTEHSSHGRLLAILFAIFVFLPSSLFIAGVLELGWIIRTALFAFGIWVVYLGAHQPGWMPASIWEGPFGRHYLGATMACASLWSISHALLSNASATLPLGIAALFASAAAIRSALRIS